MSTFKRENSLKMDQGRFQRLSEITSAMQEEGLYKCGLIFGIDYTMSNKVQGEKTFGGKCLHDISEDELNPYQEVITILGETLQPLDEDGLIPAFGFGDSRTKGDAIFPLKDVYHILVIAADGQVNSEEETTAAIVEASNWPLSIVTVGVGDGPWGTMNEFDNKLPKRNFDNFQFLCFQDVVDGARNRKTAFALHALMEIPDQYAAIEQLGLMEKLEDE
ncbi:CPNA2-like protein [Mya arenaria]|uniref:CPNA2-like protein n=1 Tax=Mya arenaria TaxID=6604 RepID=A0ABY7F8V0_MYAAR|nr:CPNA2-like protein [Mya arenaria]